MNFESLGRGDLTRAGTLWNDAAPYDRLTPDLLSEKIWQDPDFCSDLAIASSHTGRLTGFVHAVIRKMEGGSRGVVKMLAVAPEFQRQGVASALLDRVGQQLATAGATEIRVGESPPNYLVPGVDLRYEGALALFTRHGYEPFAQAVNMEGDLTTWEPRSTPTDEAAIIRRVTQADAEPLRQLISAHWGLWWGEVAQALGNVPPTLFVAVEGNRVIGFAAHDANNRGTGWFGPMGTDAEARGRGLGKRLLDATLADMRQQGHARAIIPWVGPVEFYARHASARVSRTFQRFRKPLVPATAQ